MFRSSPETAIKLNAEHTIRNQPSRICSKPEIITERLPAGQDDAPQYQDIVGSRIEQNFNDRVYFWYVTVSRGRPLPLSAQQPDDAQLGSGAVWNVASETTSSRLPCRITGCCFSMAVAMSGLLDAPATSIERQRETKSSSIPLEAVILTVSEPSGALVL